MCDRDIAADPCSGTRTLRARAVTTAERIPSFPNVPTIAESGFPGYDVMLWYGLIGPKGLPAEIVRQINGEIGRILLLPAAVDKFKDDGAVPAGGTSEPFKQRISNGITSWCEVVGALKIKID